MNFDLEIKIESAKPLSEKKKQERAIICESVNFETAAATIIYLSEILELYDNSESRFKLIHWAGPNMYWVGHDEWEISTKHLKIHRNRDYEYDSDREEVNCISDEVHISGFKKGNEIEWNGEVPTFSDNMIILFRGINETTEKQILKLTKGFFDKFTIQHITN